MANVASLCLHICYLFISTDAQTEKFELQGPSISFMF